MTYAELWLDTVLQKRDAELFKELYRLYPLAEVEDYFKGGQWQCELMKMDIQAFFAHREEAGAGDLPPLDEVTLPQLPENRKAMAPMAVGNNIGAPVTPKEGRTIIVSPSLPLTEMQQLLVFVNKYGLDLTKSKALLAPLELPLREKVMSSFAPGDGDLLLQLQKCVESGVQDGESTAATLTETRQETVAGQATGEPNHPKSSPIKSIAPVVVPAKTPPVTRPVERPPVKTPPVRAPVRAPVSTAPAKAMPASLAASIKRPLVSATKSESKRPKLVPQRLGGPLPPGPVAPGLVKPEAAEVNEQHAQVIRPPARAPPVIRPAVQSPRQPVQVVRPPAQVGLPCQVSTFSVSQQPGQTGACPQVVRPPFQMGTFPAQMSTQPLQVVGQPMQVARPTALQMAAMQMSMNPQSALGFVMPTMWPW